MNLSIVYSIAISRYLHKCFIHNNAIPLHRQSFITKLFQKYLFPLKRKFTHYAFAFSRKIDIIINSSYTIGAEKMLLRLKLKDLYEERGLTQKKVSEATGIRASTLSGLANNLRTSWDVEILERLMVYFELNDIRQMIEFEPPQNVNDYIQKFDKKDKK